MGQIQQGINQLLSTAGFMANLSPQLRQMAETRTKLSNLRQQEKTMTEARDIAMKPGEKEQYQEDIHGIKKQIFETKPTAESYKEYRESALHGEPIITTKVDPDDPDIIREAVEDIERQRTYEQAVDQALMAGGGKPYYSRDQVMSTMATKGMDKVQQKAQRRNFMKALGAESVNFGAGAEGTVSELPKNLQKAIAANFSKAERKELMDKYYGNK